MAKKKYYYVIHHKSVKSCQEVLGFVWEEPSISEPDEPVLIQKDLCLRYVNDDTGDLRVLVSSELPFDRLKKIIKTNKEYIVGHHYNKYLEIEDQYFNLWANKESGKYCYQVSTDGGKNYYDYDYGDNEQIDEQFDKGEIVDDEDNPFYVGHEMSVIGAGFTITDITKHYVVDQRAKRFELEEDFYDELSEAYINKPTKKLTKYRIDFEGKRVCEYYSESIGNGTALDYWDEVTGYQEIEYYGSDEDLKNDLEIYAEEEEDEYCGVKFNNHLWLSQILSYIAEEVGDSDWYSNDKETIINTGFDYKGKDDNDIVAEYLERADGDFSETETIGLYVKSLRVTTIS